MKGNNSKYILDGLMVFLNFAGARGNILLYWLLGLTDLIVVQTIVVCIDILYLFYRFRGFGFIGNIGVSAKLAPLYFTFL